MPTIRADAATGTLRRRAGASAVGAVGAGGAGAGVGAVTTVGA